MEKGVCGRPSCGRVLDVVGGLDDVTPCPHCAWRNDNGSAACRYRNTRVMPSLSTPDPNMSAAPAPAVPATAYADGNPKSAQGAKKYSLRLLPLPANVAVNQALADGLIKYGAANWRKTGVAASVYVDAAMRHLNQWFDGGQKLASDSKVHNLGHAMACLAILIDAEHNGSLIDDRPMPCRDTDALLLRGTE